MAQIHLGYLCNECSVSTFDWPYAETLENDVLNFYSIFFIFSLFIFCVHNFISQLSASNFTIGLLQGNY